MLLTLYYHIYLILRLTELGLQFVDPLILALILVQQRLTDSCR